METPKSKAVKRLSVSSEQYRDNYDRIFKRNSLPSNIQLTDSNMGEVWFMHRAILHPSVMYKIEELTNVGLKIQVITNVHMSTDYIMFSTSTGVLTGKWDLKTGELVFPAHINTTKKFVVDTQLNDMLDSINYVVEQMKKHSWDKGL